MVVPLVIVVQYIKKTVSQLLLCSIVMQEFRYFMGFWSCCYLFFYIYAPEKFESRFFLNFYYFFHYLLLSNWSFLLLMVFSF